MFSSTLQEAQRVAEPRLQGADLRRCASSASRPTPESVPSAWSVIASTRQPRSSAAATTSSSVERPSPDTDVCTWKSPISAPSGAGKPPVSAASISPASSRSTGGMKASPSAA
jgi:hypothetical protein